MVTFDLDPCLTGHKIAAPLSLTFLRHCLQGNVGSPFFAAVVALEVQRNNFRVLCKKYYK